MNRPRLPALLTLAAGLSGVNPDQIIPRPRPRPLEPAQAEVDAIRQYLAALGIDVDALVGQAQGDLRLFVDLAERELAASTPMSWEQARAELSQVRSKARVAAARDDLRKLGIPADEARVQEHAAMKAEMRELGERFGPIIRTGAPAPFLASAVERFQQYEERCAREAMLAGLGASDQAPTASADTTIDLNPMYELGVREATIATADGVPLVHISMRAENPRPTFEFDHVARFRGQALPPPGPGIQIRDARTAARKSLRDVAALCEVTHVELGEMERGVRPVPPMVWDRARAILPSLPFAMPPETARPRTDEEREQDRAAMDAFLHPAGRCTCGGGGGGDCEWCVMDRRRTLRTARRPRSIPCTCTPDSTCDACYQRGYDDANPEERVAERARKREVRRAKQARRKARGW